MVLRIPERGPPATSCLGVRPHPSCQSSSGRFESKQTQAYLDGEPSESAGLLVFVALYIRLVASFVVLLTYGSSACGLSVR
jgi:hypothetical protein